jgi:PPM family protein phosphatase
MGWLDNSAFHNGITRLWQLLHSVVGTLKLKLLKVFANFVRRKNHNEETWMIDTIRSAYATHAGNIRDLNEDYFHMEPELGLWIVADGMGGHESGEVASAMTVDVVHRSVEAGEPLAKSLVAAHEAVIQAADSDPGKSGMGATVVVLKITGNCYEIAWVGDSRVYRYSRTNGLKLLTHDHSYVQLLVDNELISPEDAKNHPMSHVVNQAIGSSPKGTVSVDTVSGTVDPGDRFLLCTDGLTNELSDDGIADVLRQEIDHQAAADQLIQEALTAGGGDNVTVVIVEIGS